MKTEAKVHHDMNDMYGTQHDYSQPLEGTTDLDMPWKYLLSVIVLSFLAIWIPFYLFFVGLYNCPDCLTNARELPLATAHM